MTPVEEAPRHVHAADTDSDCAKCVDLRRDRERLLGELLDEHDGDAEDALRAVVALQVEAASRPVSGDTEGLRERVGNVAVTLHYLADLMESRVAVAPGELRRLAADLAVVQPLLDQKDREIERRDALLGAIEAEARDFLGSEVSWVVNCGQTVLRMFAVDRALASTTERSDDEEANHSGPHPMYGYQTTHKGRRDACTSPECRDAVRRDDEGTDRG